MPVWVLFKEYGSDHYNNLTEVSEIRCCQLPDKWVLVAKGRFDQEYYDLAAFSSREAAERELINIASAINSGFNVVKVKGDVSNDVKS